jgi:hypothetical protein
VDFGAVGDVVLWFQSEYRLTLFIEDVEFLFCVSCDLSIAPPWCDDTCFVSAVICPSLVIGVMTPVLSLRKDFIAFWV